MSMDSTNANFVKFAIIVTTIAMTTTAACNGGLLTHICSMKQDYFT
jgi:hypothetical protein